jgi:hypothetical protein
MLPFKFFHCGKVGDFSSKCPIKRNNINEKERKGKDRPSDFKKSFKRNSFIQRKTTTSMKKKKKKSMI